MFDPNVIIGKLTYIDSRLNRLRKFSEITLKEYQENLDCQDIVERNLKNLIQAAADTNRYLLKKQLDLSSSELSEITNRDSFLRSAQAGILPKSLAEKLSESGKIWDVLAYLYDEVLPESVIEAMGNTLLYYPIYSNAIQSYLETMENEQC